MVLGSIRAIKSFPNAPQYQNIKRTTSRRSIQGQKDGMALLGIEPRLRRTRSRSVIHHNDVCYLYSLN